MYDACHQVEFMRTLSYHYKIEMLKLATRSHIMRDVHKNYKYIYSLGLWRWYIMDIIHPPVFYLRNNSLNNRQDNGMSRTVTVTQVISGRLRNYVN
jgi:hypothetical protein